jgi:hypothetical protein
VAHAFAFFFCLVPSVNLVRLEVLTTDILSISCVLRYDSVVLYILVNVRSNLLLPLLF